MSLDSIVRMQLHPCGDDYYELDRGDHEVLRLRVQKITNIAIAPMSANGTVVVFFWSTDHWEAVTSRNWQERKSISATNEQIQLLIEEAEKEALRRTVWVLCSETSWPEQ